MSSQLPVWLVVTLLLATQRSAGTMYPVVFSSMCSDTFLLCHSLLSIGARWMSCFHSSLPTLKTPSPPSGRVVLWPLPVLSRPMVGTV